MRFAAFIMTYERAGILEETINKLLLQTLPPEEILIVDNSESKDTYKLWQKIKNPKITYYNMGYNAGPAGAANFGLKTLTDKGYDWIFWGDDDDPPKNENDLKELIEFTAGKKNIGIVGEVGGRFIKNRVRTVGFKNKELKEVMDADYVTGGKLMIVNSEVIKKDILPTKKMFFGFEELDFCLKVKKNGYRIIFNGDEVKRRRKLKGKDDPNYKWKGKSFGEKDSVWRQYYSIRNMFYILKKNKFYKGYLFFLMKSFFKIIFSLRYGVNYAYNVLIINIMAIVHHWKGIYGFYNIKDRLR